MNTVEYSSLPGVIEDLVKMGKMVILSGNRRTGKSTVAQQFYMKYHIMKFSGPSCTYFWDHAPCALDNFLLDHQICDRFPFIDFIYYYSDHLKRLRKRFSGLPLNLARMEFRSEDCYYFFRLERYLRNRPATTVLIFEDVHPHATPSDDHSLDAACLRAWLEAFEKRSPDLISDHFVKVVHND